MYISLSWGDGAYMIPSPQVKAAHSDFLPKNAACKGKIKWLFYSREADKHYVKLCDQG